MKPLKHCRGIAVLLLSCLLSPVEAQAPPPAVTLRPLQPLVRGADAQLFSQVPTLLLSRDDFDLPRICDGDALEITDVDGLLARLHHDDLIADRLQWKLPDGNLLLLTGDAAVVATCNRELDRFAAVLRRPVEVTVWRLTAGGTPLPAGLDADGLTKALAEHPPLWTQTAVRQGSELVRFADTRLARYVRDVDVVIAKDASIGHPLVTFAAGGLRVDCALTPLPAGDELLVETALQLGEDLQVDTVSPCKDLPDLDLLHCQTAIARGAARLPSGSAMVFDLQARDGAGPNCRLVLRARFLTPPPVPVNEGVLVAPVGALLLDDGEERGPLRPCLLSAKDAVEATAMMPSIAGSITGDTLLAWLAAQFDDKPDAVIQAGFLIASADAAQQRKIVQALQQLVDARLQNVALQFETRAAEAVSPLQYAPLWSVSLPAVTTRPCAGFVGTERTTIATLECEVAEGTAIYNPTIAVCQTGLWSALWLGEPGDAIRLRGNGLVVSHEPARERTVGGSHDGRIGLADASYSMFVLPDSLSPGQEFDLGDGPVAAVGGQQLRTRQLVRLLRR